MAAEHRIGVHEERFDKCDGRERIGATLHVPVGDDVVPVTVTDSVLFDKEGTRRDG